MRIASTFLARRSWRIEAGPALTWMIFDMSMPLALAKAGKRIQPLSAGPNASRFPSKSFGFLIPVSLCEMTAWGPLCRKEKMALMGVFLDMPKAAVPRSDTPMSALLAPTA